MPILSSAGSQASVRSLRPSNETAAPVGIGSTPATAEDTAAPAPASTADVGVNDTTGPRTDASRLPPAERPATSGNAINIRAGGGPIDESGTARQPVTHPPLGPVEGLVDPFRHEGSLTYTGAKLKQDVLDLRYNKVPAERFGTTEVTLPDGRKHITNDALYPLGDGKVGMHLIGAKDGPAGSAAVDKFLREATGLADGEPVYAFYSHFHPEEHAGTLQDFGGHSYKTQQAFSHTAAYLGNGKTTNSPSSMNDRWNFGTTGANLQIISLEGTDQLTLNKNAHIVDGILNNNVAFAGGYTDDNVTQADLNSTLMFYRDWIRQAPHVTDKKWRTYCAEHKTVVANVLVNVPHNPAAFREIFGEMEGNKLWLEFKDRYKSINGREFTAADETYFEPLWKKEGLTPEQIRPFKDDAEHTAYTLARKSGQLESFAGRRALEPGRGMVWAPESSADLLQSFVELYTPVRKVGGAIASSSLFAFKDKIKDRIGVSDDRYLELAGAVSAKMMLADAMMRAEGPDHLQKAAGELYVALGGDAAELLAGAPKAELMAVVQQILAPTKQALPSILQDPSRASSPRERIEQADAWLQQAIAPDLEVARAVPVPAVDRTEYNSGPAIFHRASIGKHPLNSHVNLRTVATVIDADAVA